MIESGEPREVMHFCMLCGYGASAINPYLAFETIQKLHADGDLPAGVPADVLTDQYITAVKKGILKTISKMGISTLRSYQFAQQFEAVGLDRSVIDRYFTGTPSRIAGSDLGRDRPRGDRAAPHRLPAAPNPVRSISTSAANTSSGSTAKSTSGIPTRSSSCNTPSSRTIRKSMPSTPRR